MFYFNFHSGFRWMTANPNAFPYVLIMNLNFKQWATSRCFQIAPFIQICRLNSSTLERKFIMTTQTKVTRGILNDRISSRRPVMSQGQWSYLLNVPWHMLSSGHSLSSTCGCGHWFFSCSPGTGKPESKSKQARKRLWTETIWLPLTAPSRRVLLGFREE